MLYVIALDRPPGGELAVAEIRLLGCTGELEWRQDDKGLVVSWPEKTGEHAFVFRMTGSGLIEDR